MAAKLFLAESTDNSVGTHTVYTVPADKAARIRIMINSSGSGGGSSQFAIMIGPEGSQTVFATVVSSEHETWTGFRFDGTDGYPKNIGIHCEQAGWNATTDDAEKDWIAPLPVDFYLSTGDTVKQISSTGTMGDGLLFQVMGVEDDA
jgi:hypothetical protein